jgi:hypothetical protein
MKLIPSNKVVTGEYPITFLVTILASASVSSSLSKFGTLKYHISAGGGNNPKLISRKPTLPPKVDSHQSLPVWGQISREFSDSFQSARVRCQCWNL